MVKKDKMQFIIVNNRGDLRDRKTLYGNFKIGGENQWIKESGFSFTP